MVERKFHATIKIDRIIFKFHLDIKTLKNFYAEDVVRYLCLSSVM